MRAIIIERCASPVAPNVRLVSDWPEVGAPGAGEVVVRTLASALNQMDLWVGRGVPGLDLTYPRVSGCDMCGVVEAVGAGVNGAWVGKRVVMNAALVVQGSRGPTEGTRATLAPEYQLIGEHHHQQSRLYTYLYIINIKKYFKFHTQILFFLTRSIINNDSGNVFVTHFSM